MVFSSTLFLFAFLPVTLLVYYLIKDKFKNYWLLLVSIVFFGWSQPNYVWIILLNVFINWSCALLIDKCKKISKITLVITVVANLAVLFYFKYFNFIIDTINRIIRCNITLREIILPIGISFFTFQGMSYVIDVYRGDVSVQKNIIKVGLYVMLFPQLIAGPIVRYKDIEREIDNRAVKLEDFTYGLERFIIGLGKKVIIANTMAAAVDAIWDNGIANLTCLISWFGSIAYTLQIYFDFSGYSDMAIGLGRMFGFHFNENFNLPYISKSISEFWRRWHISVSSWFRDYVYIPLGGNRKHVYINLSIVFVLTGIWHGAAWNFALWGIWNLLFVLIERVIGSNKKKREKCKKEKSALSKVFSVIYTLFVVNMGWVLFRAPNISDALSFIKTMFGINRAQYPWYNLFWYFDRWTLFILGIGIIFSTALPARVSKIIQKYIPEKIFVSTKYVGLLLVLFYAIIRIVSGSYNPFIYFQF